MYSEHALVTISNILVISQSLFAQREPHSQRWHVMQVGLAWARSLSAGAYVTLGWPIRCICWFSDSVPQNWKL